MIVTVIVVVVFATDAQDFGTSFFVVAFITDITISISQMTRFAEEIFDWIVAFVTSDPSSDDPSATLASLSLTSRCMKRISTLYLYSKGTVYCAETESGTVLMRLLPLAYTLFKHPEYAATVRTFVLDGDYGTSSNSHLEEDEEDFEEGEDEDEDKELVDDGWEEKGLSMRSDNGVGKREFSGCVDVSNTAIAMAWAYSYVKRWSRGAQHLRIERWDCGGYRLCSDVLLWFCRVCHEGHVNQFDTLSCEIEQVPFWPPLPIEEDGEDPL
jgi:hypothetical protein